MQQFTNKMVLFLLFFQVKTSGPKHTCGSFNNCGETMASNNWVAERVVDLLPEDPEMRPKKFHTIEFLEAS